MTAKHPRSLSSITRRTFTKNSSAILSIAGCGSVGLGCTPQSAKFDAQIIVIGAGLSGLNAALWLQGAGLDVLVVEASQRIGGRIRTLDTLPGRPEAGGQQVGQSYARIRQRAAQFNIPVKNSQNTRTDRLLCFGNQQTLASEWKQSSRNIFPDQFKKASPDGALFAASASQNPFSSSDDWLNAASPKTDLSAADFLTNQGFDAEAQALINIALNANDLESYSMANVWRSLQLYQQDSAIGLSGSIEGGAQRLPEAMAGEIKKIKINFKVNRINSTQEAVEISDGSNTLRAQHCIAALPFPVLNNISLNPKPPILQQFALKNLPYTQILQLHLTPEFPFWERDGLPISMWTDSPIERIFPITNTENDTVGLLAWINGTGATALQSSSDEQLGRLVKDQFKQFRPSSNGKITLNETIRWTKNNPLAGGAYMHWAPGQIQKFAATMGNSIGRIHLAGEHLSLLHTGMEGAMESGQNAALAIMEKMNI